MQNGGDLAMLSRTTDGGQTWETPRAIFDPGGGTYTDPDQIVVLPDGTLINLMDVGRGQNDKKIGTLSLIRSTDKGQTWSSSPIRVAAMPEVPVTDPDTGQPVAAFVNGGWPHVAAVSPNGNLYAVWQDSSFSNSQYNTIAFSMSTDGGYHWSTPIQVNQTPTGIPAGDRQAFLPAVAVAADGTVAVTYYDFRLNDANPGLLTDYWLVQAPAGSDPTDPASWRHEARLTDASFDLEKAAIWTGEGYWIGDYEGLAATGNRFNAFFSATNGNDPGDIYFRDAVVVASTPASAAVSALPASQTMTDIASGATRPALANAPAPGSAGDTIAISTVAFTDSQATGSDGFSGGADPDVGLYSLGTTAPFKSLITRHKARGGSAG
jgi:hypothetical protein